MIVNGQKMILGQNAGKPAIANVLAANIFLKENGLGQDVGVKATARNRDAELAYRADGHQPAGLTINVAPNAAYIGLDEIKAQLQTPEAEQVTGIQVTSGPTNGLFSSNKSPKLN